MSGTIESRTLIPFGPFEADLTSQELRKHGVRLHLPRQSFQILKMLLERPGQLVSREEMRAALWPSDTFVDFEHSLNAAINKLREALGDVADDPSYIETLPKRGYRFIVSKAPQTIPPEPSHPPTPEPPSLPRSSPPRRSFVRLAAAILIVLTVVIIILAITGLGKKLWSHSGPPPQIRSLAVLPLVNLSGDPQQEYFADGMTEELIAELSRISSLRVISRTSVMQYQGEKRKPIPQIGRELNVDAIMEGSVLRTGNRVRIAAELIYAPTDQHLMAEMYESDLGDVLKLQREVAEAVAEKVRAKLTPEQQGRLHETPKVDPEAHQAYLIATSLDWVLLQENETARSYLEKAIQEDPGFAQAHGALALTYVFLGEQRLRSPQDAYPPAKQAVRQALELDEKNCDTHLTLYRISHRYDWDWPKAEREISYALELCPNAVDPHWYHAYYLAWNGRVAEAMAEVAKCRELDPVRSEPLWIEAVANYHFRNYKALLEVSRSFTTLRPNRWVAHYWVGVGYEGLGQTLEAIPEYQKAVELSQGNSDAVASLAHAYATTGNRAEAEKILHQFLEQSESSFVSPYMIATVYAGLGDKDKAFEYLEKAYQIRSTDLPYFLRADLRMDGLRSDPRFENLLRRMNFPK